MVLLADFMRRFLVPLLFLAVLSGCSTPASGGDAQGKDDIRETPARKERLMSIMRERMRTNNVPINFYGKVIDQNGAAVAGAQVNTSIRLVKEPIPGMIGDSFDKSTLITASDGTFALVGKVGEFLSIKDVVKDGYVTSGKLRTSTFWYYESEERRFRPNPAVPVVFTIWKLAGAEPLKVVKSAFEFSANDGFHGLDILEGKKPKSSETTDLKVSMTAPVVVGLREKYNWSFVFKVENGGLIETTDDYMFLAPIDGYTPRIEVNFTSSDAGWQDYFEKSFYLKSRGGSVYARVKVYVKRGNDGSAIMEVESYANPNSSRNLEYVP